MQLPVLGQPPIERADAARNRARIVEAARMLFAANGVGAVTMDDVARAAGVGKGTLYRRFGDKAGLGIAVLDDDERDLQDRILRGPPPLGPGAAPKARLLAFFDAYHDLVVRNLGLVTMCETASPGARFRSGVYAAWRWHVGALLRDMRCEHPDILVHYLLASVGGDVQSHLADSDTSATAARAAIHELIDGLGPRGTT